MSSTAVHFVIPVRHHATIRDWDAVVERMEQTLASVIAQTSASWTATVVANTGTPLPAMPFANFRTVRVDLPAVVLPDQHRQRDAFYTAVRTDKGRRVLAGLEEAGGADFVMVLDFDDFIHRDLVSFVEGSNHQHGWFLDSGYAFDGSRLILRVRSGFNHLCGSSHIVRADAFRASPLDDASVQRLLGSHRFIQADLAAAGRPLARLPFPGAVYRIGHDGNTSGSGSIARTFFKLRSSVRHPVRMVQRLASLRTVDRQFERDYFAGRHLGSRP